MVKMVNTILKAVKEVITSADDAIKTIKIQGDELDIEGKKVIIVTNCLFKGVSFAVVAEALNIDEIYFKDCIFIECELVCTDVRFSDDILCIYVDTDIHFWIPKGLDIYTSKWENEE